MDSHYRVLVVKYFAREPDPTRLGQSPEASGESIGISDCVFNLANVQVIRDTPSPTIQRLGPPIASCGSSETVRDQLAQARSGQSL